MNEKLEKLNQEIAKTEAKLRQAEHKEKMLEHQIKKRIKGQSADIILESIPGYGDVQILLQDGKTLFVESKKSKQGKSSQEYPLMREAIGQLMTSCFMNENTVPTVAVPYTKKSLELAERWSKLEQIQKVGIRFILVQESGNIVTI